MTEPQYGGTQNSDLDLKTDVENSVHIKNTQSVSVSNIATNLNNDEEIKEDGCQYLKDYTKYKKTNYQQ
jgi:hypothetical protein